MKVTNNKNGILVKKACCSCAHKDILGDGKRYCNILGKKVNSSYCCSNWEISNNIDTIGDGHEGICHTLEYVNSLFRQAQQSKDATGAYIYDLEMYSKKLSNV